MVKPLGLDQRAEPSPARDEGLSSAEGQGVWERIFERKNLFAALKRVKENKGAPGIDGMTVEELPEYLRAHWLEVRAHLDAGDYEPQPVRRQAITQVMTPQFEPRFSEHSYGFRPGRRAHDAVKAAQGYIREGYTWVVDIDLEKFFDLTC